MQTYDPLKIRQLRESHTMTLAEFAAQIGVKKQHVYNWEHGKNRPKGKTLEKIAHVFGVSISFFYRDNYYHTGNNNKVTPC